MYYRDIKGIFARYTTGILKGLLPGIYYRDIKGIIARYTTGILKGLLPGILKGY